jgi:hypothetical protein
MKKFFFFPGISFIFRKLDERNLEFFLSLFPPPFLFGKRNEEKAEKSLFYSFLTSFLEKRRGAKESFSSFCSSPLLFKRGKGNRERRKTGIPLFLRHLFHLKKKKLKRERKEVGILSNSFSLLILSS